MFCTCDSNDDLEIGCDFKQRYYRNLGVTEIVAIWFRFNT